MILYKILSTKREFLVSICSLLVLLIFAFILLVKSDNSFNEDLGEHIKIGEIIVTEKFIPKTNLFSYTNPDFPIINDKILFEVLVYVGKRYVGLGGLLLIKTAIIFISVCFTFAAVYKKSPWLILPVGFIFLHLIRDRLELRPEILSFFLTSVTMFILLRFRFNKTKFIWLIPLIQLFWINSHIYFLVGFALVGVFFLAATFRRNFSDARVLFIILLLSLILSIINFNGIKGIFYPFFFSNNYAVAPAENLNIFAAESLGLNVNKIFSSKFVQFLQYYL